jgi:hypothetical protein
MTQHTEGPWYRLNRLITVAPELDEALRDLLEWVKGNRGRKDVNPYLVPEVKAALKVLAQVDGIDDYLNVDTGKATR